MFSCQNTILFQVYKYHSVITSFIITIYEFLDILLHVNKKILYLNLLSGISFMKEYDLIKTQRLDKWLYIARIFKTRKSAASACDNRHVKVNEVTSKPSKSVKAGDELTIRLRGTYRSFRISGIVKRNVNAQLAGELYEETTPINLDPEQQELIKLNHQAVKVIKYKYKGRPTKKERRNMINWKQPPGSH